MGQDMNIDDITHPASAGAYFDLSGKIAIVTGGSRGLGLEMVRAFATAGADIVIASRKLEQCEEAAHMVEGLGRRALPISCHVGKWAALQELADAAYAHFGKVDILANNAGLSPVVGASSSVTEELFDKIIDVNFKAPFRLTTIIAPRMMAGDGGSVINVSSTGAIRPKPVFTVYSGAKAAVNSMTKALALEYGPKVRVNTIMAGPFWTDISKSWREEADKTSTAAMKRIGRPHEVATTALYLASPHSSFTTGSIIQLDGGVS